MDNTKILKLCQISAIFSLLILNSCNKNTATMVEPITYGKLSSYTEGAKYSLEAITETAYSNLCLGTKPHDRQCQANLNNLKNNYKFSISQIKNNNLGITGVNEYNITYTTPGISSTDNLNYQPRTVSGAIYIPQGIAPDKVKGVVLISHLTAYNKYDFGPKADIISGLGYPSIYATNGYIVLLADGLGFGADSEELQPFSYPMLNAITSINMLKASEELFPKLGLNFPKPLNLFLNGFSYGGLVTAWASNLLQNKGMLAGINMVLKATVPIAGPFDFENAQWPMEKSNVSTDHNIYKIENQYTAALSKPALVSLMMASYEYYNSIPCTNDMLEGYCNLSDKNAGPYNTVYQLYGSNNQPNTSDIQEILWSQAQTLHYSQTNNSIKAFIVFPEEPSFLKTLYAAGISSWKTTSPVTLIHLRNDSLVTPINSEHALVGIKKLSTPGLVNTLEINNNDYLVGRPLAPIDHNNNFQYIASLFVFNKN